MASDMLKENLKIYAGSTYRSYSYQEGLYNRYVKKMVSKKLKHTLQEQVIQNIN